MNDIGRRTRIKIEVRGAQARLYVKNAKLVIQWNNGQSALYTTIELDNPGPYPVTPKVTTDTTPP